MKMVVPPKLLEALNWIDMGVMKKSLDVLMKIEIEVMLMPIPMKEEEEIQKELVEEKSKPPLLQRSETDLRS